MRHSRQLRNGRVLYSKCHVMQCVLVLFGNFLGCFAPDFSPLVSIVPKYLMEFMGTRSDMSPSDLNRGWMFTDQPSKEPVPKKKRQRKTHTLLVADGMLGHWKLKSPKNGEPSVKELSQAGRKAASFLHTEEITRGTNPPSPAFIAPTLTTEMSDAQLSQAHQIGVTSVVSKSPSTEVYPAKRSDRTDSESEPHSPPPPHKHSRPIPIEEPREALWLSFLQASSHAKPDSLHPTTLASSN